jgi:putative FmdB family regulatory protein
MPLYEYRCSKCGNVFERLQKFSDEPLTVHEDCGGPVERLISRSGFHLKGSGWYVTDYAKGSGSKPASGETKSESSANSKPADNKSGETKSGDTKSGDTKSTESKPAESKPATTTTKSE